MRLLLVFFLAVSICRTLCHSTFRFGAVLSTVGSTRTIADAKNGYALYFDAVNALADGNGLFIQGRPGTQGFYFKYEFLWREDFSDRRIHAEEVQNLLEKDRVHFLGGSHPKYAMQEMRLANQSSILCYHCCVSPDSIYERNFPTTFGITATNKDFTKLLIRQLTFAQISSLAVIYDEDDEFTRTTCQAAITFGREFYAGGREDRMVVMAFNGSDTSADMIEVFAQRAKNTKIAAVIGCVYPEKGRQLVHALDAAEYSLQALFLTVGPSKQWWVQSIENGDLVRHLLSSAQWHESMNYMDDFFGSTAEYVRTYKRKYSGASPDQDAAGASAVGLTLTKAITTAFKNCDITQTKGDVDALLYDVESIACDDGLDMTGYDRILRTLARLDIETFYGRVQFNSFRRNVALDPVTTQVFVRQTKNGEERRKIEAVLPVGYATKLLKFPANNRYPDACVAGQHRGARPFDPCEPCASGTFSDKANAKHCENCPIGYWLKTPGQSACDRCPLGTTTNFIGATRLTDCICRVGFFNRAGLNGVECEPCPDGATCEGGIDAPIPKKGYWSNSSDRREIYRCVPPSVCRGGEDSECAEGYTGRLCSGCMDGYFSVVKRCHKCMHAFSIVILSLLILCGWYVINVTVSESVASLEMILGWAQLANIIGDVDLNWTPRVETMFGIAYSLDFDVNILEPNCLVAWSFHHNFILQLCLPVVMTSMAGTGYLLSAMLYTATERKWMKLDNRTRELLSLLVEIPEDRKTLEKKWNMTIATFLASLDTTYVAIAKYCLACFKCRTVSGISVLEASPDLECGSWEHTQLIILAALGLLFYIFGYLAYIVWKLYDLRDRRAFSDEINLLRFGFVYQKYEIPYCYTPAIAIVRKLLFVLILVCVNNPAFQVGILAVVINCSIIIHVYTAPYVNTYLDILFTFLLLALMFEAFGGLMFYSENLPQENRIILEWIVIMTLFVLICVFLVIFSKEVIAKYQKYFLKRSHRHYVRKEYGYCSGGCLSRLWRWLLGNCGQSSSPNRTVSVESSASSTRDTKDICFELVDTFNPGLIFKAIKNRPDLIQDWDKLADMLKEYMSDQAETSYLSMKPTAAFWRKLVDRFPELVDFLAVADRTSLQHFSDFTTLLYRNFYLSKKLVSLPLMKIVNWKDYAPMAQWLAIAPKEDREFFIDYISRMLRVAGDEDAADLLESNLKSGGRETEPFSHIDEKKVSRRKRWILHNVACGCHPLKHSAASTDLAPSSSTNVTHMQRTDIQIQESPMVPVKNISQLTDRNLPNDAGVEHREPLTVQKMPSLGDEKCVELTKAERVQRTAHSFGEDLVNEVSDTISK